MRVEENKYLMLMEICIDIFVYVMLYIMKSEICGKKFLVKFIKIINLILNRKII